MRNQSLRNKMAEKVPAGIAPSGGAFVVNSPDAHPRSNDIIMHNIAIQPLPVEPTPSISHPHSSNAYVRPSGVQQACVSKPANKIVAPGVLAGPRNVVLHRHNGDFGFTLRHFIVYPPDSVTDPVVNPLAAVGMLNFAQPMDTVFVKKVHPNSAAHRAGLQEGDRLLAVNGLTVAAIPYSQVVATIQQTPKTLTLQVVPRNYDILQTFFSETAYNPETNQRPQPQAVSAAKVPVSAQQETPPQPYHPPHLLAMASAQKKQESLYSTLQEIVVENVVEAGAGISSSKKTAIYDEVPKIMANRLNKPSTTQQQSPQQAMLKANGSKGVAATAPGFAMEQLLSKQQQYSHIHQHLKHQPHQYLEKITVHEKDCKPYGNGSSPMVLPGNNAMVEDEYATPCGQSDSIRMSRLRKSLEQKEEFLRRPLVAAFDRGVMQQGMAGVPTNDGQDIAQHREFYGRPNRFNKLVWPPTAAHLSLEQPQEQSTPAAPGNADPTGGKAAPESSIVPLSAGASFQATPPRGGENLSASTRTHVSQLSSIREQFFIGSPAETMVQAAPKSAPPSLTVAVASPAPPPRPPPIVGTFSVASLPLPSHAAMHGVSEKTKLFESGRALSPEGFDRMNLYKSELSRINTKQVVPNVAVRRKEFELKAESTSRRMSTEDKQRSVSSDSESQRTPVRMRSLSDEPNATQKAFGRASFPPMNPFNEDNTKPLDEQCQDAAEATVSHGSSPQSGAVLAENNRTGNETSTAAVIMRPKQQHSLMVGKDDRKVRRISYLRATARENLFHLIESDAVLGSSEPSEDTTTTTGESAMSEALGASVSGPPQQETSAIDGDGLLTAGKVKSSAFVQSVQLKSHCAKSKALAHFRDSQADSTAPLLREGELNVKVTLIDGKRSADRSWRSVHAELRGNRLKMTHVRDGKISTQHTPEPCGTIDLTNFRVTEGNYTKRKNVFKLATLGGGAYYPAEPSSAGARQTEEYRMQQGASGLASLGGALPGSARELLLQADSYADMQQWMEVLRSVCCADGGEDSGANQLPGGDYVSNLGGQQAEPQRVAAQTSVQVHSGASGDDYSPILSTKSHRKYALGSRSPSGQSPVTKTRKTPQLNSSSSTGREPAPMEASIAGSRQVAIPSSQYQINQHPTNQLMIHQHHQHFGSGKENSDREGSSPKSKTWKGIVARQFRKMQGQPSESGGSGHSADLMVFPEGASINVPLQFCPVSEDDPYVPLVLTKCTGIVESKGLSVVGIYRIPGNTAAITQLTETINRGLDEATLSDPRWDDVNVVSSLLKSFIRNLPEPLLPKELYGGFIAADKLSGARRLIELRQLLRRIPPMNYETLKHLMRHLYRVSTNSEVNLMDPRNLAIVFGPSVVRSANESLETAVKDMRHQCQIVEVLINYYQYFFEDGPLPSVEEKIIDATVVDSGVEDPSTSLLLDNVSKIEPLKESSKESSSGFVANIVQAANRKIRRSAQRKSTMSSTTPDTLSLDSTMSAESKEQTMRITRRCIDIQKTRATAGSLSSDGKQMDEDSTVLLVKTGSTGPCADALPAKDLVDRGQQHRHRLTKKEENLLQLHHHHHHHHHYYHSSRHHSAQSNDDASAVSSRSSEDDSNDSTFADNGDMSLKTVTIALDNKLRSLRNSSIDDSDRDLALECSEGDLSSVGSGNVRHSLHQQYHMGRTARPLTLGENIPYADESPERPLVQSRSKPLRQSGKGAGSGMLMAHSGEDVPLKKASSAGLGCEAGSSTHSSTNDSCLTLVNETDALVVGAGGDHGDTTAHEDDAASELVGVGRSNMVLSSDETDSSTTSNPHEKLTATTYRIDTEVLKKMNRILTQLERKANNLERKFNLNRSLSLNYKSPKAVDCCCLLQQGGGGAASGPLQIAHAHPHPGPPLHYWTQQQPPQSQQQLPTANNNNVTNCFNQNSPTVAAAAAAPAAGISSLRARLSLTKDEKTDKNINRRRLLLDSHVGNAGAGAPAGGGGGGGSAAGCLLERGGKYVSANCGGESSCPHMVVAACHSGAAGGGAGQTAAAGGNVGGGRQRRHAGSRSIRRRHTVGGTHDYLSNKINTQDYHHHHHQYYAGQGCCPLRRT
ncbi:uncharacterized protein LOC131290650 [Anopheles ziemanni]|uniref:uncharacterized protein LOC131269119 n=1 Tax=Anopheles coustani TaxID=139045 RepID=UPI00265B0AB0|nr:uncharacterized protein LOC131269119 [Anopheles coustani]XP_058175796.1 uncharacterized protein LOC131290650 [Anopheles ziemanni]